MIKKIKETNIFYAMTATIDSKGIIQLVNSYEGNLVIAYVMKHDRTRLRVPNISLIKNSTAPRRSTCKALIRFINEYCATPYEEAFTGDSIRYSVFFKFLNENYGFNIKYNNTKAIQKINKNKNLLTGLDIKDNI